MDKENIDIFKELLGFTKKEIERLGIDEKALEGLQELLDGEMKFVKDGETVEDEEYNKELEEKQRKLFERALAEERQEILDDDEP